MTAATLESTVKILLAWIMSRCNVIVRCVLVFVCMCVCVRVGKTAMIFGLFVCEEVRFLSVYLVLIGCEAIQPEFCSKKSLHL